MSGDSRGLFSDDPKVAFTKNLMAQSINIFGIFESSVYISEEIYIYTCRCIRFCQTAFSSGDGARNMSSFRAPFFGVLDKSGVQCTVGLSAAIRPFASIVMRNSVSVERYSILLLS